MPIVPYHPESPLTLGNLTPWNIKDLEIKIQQENIIY